MSFLRTINIPVLISAILLLLVGGSLSVSAQKRLKFSTTEDIAIAFYKTGGIVPNFERWIKEREPYNLTPWTRREGVMAEETARLQLAYTQFKPADDFLLIRTFVKLAPQKHVNDAGEKTYTLPVTFAKAPEALYFPYDFLDERIVVMPHKMDLLMNSPIDQTQYEFINKASKNSAQNTMIVRLRSTEADTSRPYKIDGLDQWVLKAEIVSLEVWSKKGALLWEYTVPWYISPNTIRLNRLYEGRPTETPEIGAVKALFPKEFIEE